MPRAPRRLALAVPVLLLLPSCSAPSAPRSPSPRRADADKAALFGDPSLVPTREGEHAREEVALAQEIERAIDVLPPVEDARVNVELPSPRPAWPYAAPTPEPRVDPTLERAVVLAVVRARSEADPEVLSSHVRTIASAVVGSSATIEVVMELRPAPSVPPQPTPWLLLLGVLGLGWCGGTLLERARRLRRAQAARRARR